MITGPDARLPLPTLALGTGVTAVLGYSIASPAPPVPFALLAALMAFLGLVLAFATVPHLAVAASIPFFALLPTLKTLYAPALAPAKDVVVVAAAVAATLVAVINVKAGRGSGIERRIAAPAAILLALYAVNLGGGFRADAFDLAWMHGVRLNWEPILLLLSGLVLGSRRVLAWSLASLVVTGVIVALYGLWQQSVSTWQLVDMGYSYEQEVRTIGDRLRSFGTLDDAFAYAGFLLLPLTALLFCFRRRPLVVVAALVLLAGVTVAYVRTSAVVIVALLALWVLRTGQVVAALGLLGASLVAAVAFLATTSGATQSQTVQPEASLYLTLNGRTDVWQVTLKDPATWPLGQGVGEIGVARQRASEEVSRDEPAQTSTVDSAYLATVADIGFVGLAARLLLVAMVGIAAARAAAAGLRGGWFALGILASLLIDALTRDSFTGFPTAFVGMLLVGVALAATREQQLTAMRKAA